MARVIAGVGAGIAESRIDALHLVRSEGVTVLHAAGVDVDERPHVVIAGRRHHIVVHAAHLPALEALEVVGGGLDAVDEHLDRLARERLELLRHRVDGHAGERGDEILRMAGRPHLLRGKCACVVVRVHRRPGAPRQIPRNAP